MIKIYPKTQTRYFIQHKSKNFNFPLIFIYKDEVFICLNFYYTTLKKR